MAYYRPIYTESDWIFIICNYLRSTSTQAAVKNKIRAFCLMNIENYYGQCVPVDDQKIWKLVVLNDPACKKRLQELKITDFISFQSHYEEAKYRQMRRTFPRNKHKKG